MKKQQIIAKRAAEAEEKAAKLAEQKAAKKAKAKAEVSGEDEEAIAEAE